MKKWLKNKKTYGAWVLILITALAAVAFIYLKDSGLNTDNLTSLLGKQQKTAFSESMESDDFIKTSPNPALVLKREPTSAVKIPPEKQEAGKNGEEAPAVTSAAPDPSYTAPGVYVEEIQVNRPITGTVTDVTAFVGITETKPSGNAPRLIRSFQEYQQHYGGFLPESMGQYGHLPDAVKGFFDNGGARCYIVSVTPAEMNNIVPDDFLADGIATLEQLRDVRIVAAPGVFDADIQQGIIDHCEAMHDRFAILDMPDMVRSSGELREHREQFDSACAAFYHPWLQIRDDETGENRYIPPSGAIAGIYAVNDRTRGVHKAPASIPVNGITGLKYTLTESDQQEMNPNGINVIRFFPGRGYLVWGARTCSSYDEFKYVNVKRYFLYLQQSIREGTAWIIFEPNNEQIWARTAQSVENFLNDEWRKGALMGTKPEEAYFVKMDHETMSNYDLEQGKRILMFGVAPIKPAEFIVSSVAHE